MLNDFYELAPQTITSPDSPLWSYFHEDMLCMQHPHTALLIDLGWYPDGDPTGTFHAVVICMCGDTDQQARAWDTPIAQLTSRSRLHIVAQLEAWLLDYGSGKVS